jgi:hypothetical protein
MKMVEERLQIRLSSWKGKLLYLGGRFILTNSVLDIVYDMSKGILKILDYFRSRFFWQGYNEKEKY